MTDETAALAAAPSVVEWLEHANRTAPPESGPSIYELHAALNADLHAFVENVETGAEDSGNAAAVLIEDLWALYRDWVRDRPAHPPATLPLDVELLRLDLRRAVTDLAQPTLGLAGGVNRGEVIDAIDRVFHLATPEPTKP